jgi:hypothetical protein
VRRQGSLCNGMAQNIQELVIITWLRSVSQSVPKSVCVCVCVCVCGCGSLSLWLLPSMFCSGNPAAAQVAVTTFWPIYWLGAGQGRLDETSSRTSRNTIQYQTYRREVQYLLGKHLAGLKGGGGEVGRWGGYDCKIFMIHSCRRQSEWLQ